MFQIIINVYLHSDQIIGTSSRTPSPETDSLIAAMLSDRYFIPILRPVDYSSPAQIGKPWSPDTYVKSPGPQVTSPLVSILYLRVSPSFGVSAPLVHFSCSNIQ